MEYKGVNMSSVKAANRASVLYLLNERGAISRKDIAQTLGLTPAAVTKICADLIGEGCISNCGVADAEIKAGRKKILLSINSDRLYVLAINIEFYEYTVSLCTLGGIAVKSEKVPCDAVNADVTDYFNDVAATCNAIIKKSAVARKHILGAGVGIVGSVNCENGETTGSYGIWKTNVCVGKMLGEKLKMPVEVENNVKAFALAELIYNSSSADNILFVKWGPRVGSALVLGGEVFSGNDNSAAEIGHYIIHPNGIECRCGRKGCLETHVSAQAIVDRIRQSYSEKNTPRLFSETNGDINGVTFDLIRNDKVYDKSVAEIIDRRINRMARAVVNAATITDPDKVIIFGYLFTQSNAAKFVKDCKKYYSRFDDGFIEISTLQDKVDYIGPAAVAAKRCFFEK